MRLRLPWTAQAALLLATFSISLAYGVGLPVLPYLLERRLGQSLDVAWHIGLLTGTYTLALFLFAPLWGYLSDRHPRRPVIILASVGFTASLLLFAFIDSIVALYLGRFLAGSFAAAIYPVSLAMISDWAPDEDWQARRFVWLSIAGVGGLLVGPAIGGWVASMWDAGTPPTGILLLFVAAMSAAGAIAAWLFLPTRPPEPTEPNRRDASAPQLVPALLLLAAIMSAGLGTFEVGLELRAQQALDLGPGTIGLMFAECMLVMLAAQALVFNPWFPARATRWLLAPAFAALAGALALVPWMQSSGALMVAVGIFAGSAGILSPILAFWVSLVAGRAQGSELGRQSAALSLGQAIGSALGGLMFGLFPLFPDAAFLAAAVAALAGGRLALRLPMRLARLNPPPGRHPSLAR